MTDRLLRPDAVCVGCVLLAAGLCALGAGGWGWFLLIGVAGYTSHHTAGKSRESQRADTGE